MVDGIKSQWRNGAGGSWWEIHFGHINNIDALARLEATDAAFWKATWTAFENDRGYMLPQASPESFSPYTGMEAAYFIATVSAQWYYGFEFGVIVDRYDRWYRVGGANIGVPKGFGGKAAIGMVPEGLSESELREHITSDSSHLPINIAPFNGLGPNANLSGPTEIGISTPNLSVNLAGGVVLQYDPNSYLGQGYKACYVCHPNSKLPYGIPINPNLIPISQLPIY